MVEWVWELYGTGKVLEAADQKLCGGFDEKEMECLLVVGLWCAHPNYNLRPSIRQATLVLNFESPLPDLPSKMPLCPTVFRPPPTLNMPESAFSSSDGTSTTATSVSKSSQIQVEVTQPQDTRRAFSYTYNTASWKPSADITPSGSLLNTG